MFSPKWHLGFDHKCLLADVPDWGLQRGTMSCLHNGIFHFLAKAEPCLEKEVWKAFKVFDCDGTGKISFENLKVVASEVGEEITDEELQVCEVQTCSSRALLREGGERLTAGGTG